MQSVLKMVKAQLELLVVIIGLRTTRLQCYAVDGTFPTIPSTLTIVSKKGGCFT